MEDNFNNISKELKRIVSTIIKPYLSTLQEWQFLKNQIIKSAEYFIIILNSHSCLF